MTDQHNHLSHDPSAQAGSIDPTLHGNPEYTIALLPEEERWQVGELMDPHIARERLSLFEDQYWQGGDAMVLENGVRLEEQCNTNYAYLNSQGISMTQFTGALEGLRTLVLSSPGNEVSHDRLDEAWERADQTRTRSGRVLNPLSGEIGEDTEYTLSTKGLLARGVMGIEIDMARHGIFSRVQRGDFQKVSSRAEQILMRFRSTEIGQQLLREQGVNDPARRPERPIALIAIPEGPSPHDIWEQKKAVAERKATDDNTKIAMTLGDTIQALKASASKGSYDTWYTNDRHKGGKGTTFHMLVSEIPGSFTRMGQTYSYTDATWVEVTEWRKAPREFTIIQSRDYGHGTGYEPKTTTVWEEGAPARRGQKNPSGTPQESRILSVNELDELSAVVVEPNQAKLEQWRTTRQRRSGGVGRRVINLFTDY